MLFLNVLQNGDLQVFGPGMKEPVVIPAEKYCRAVQDAWDQACRDHGIGPGIFHAAPPARRKPSDRPPTFADLVDQMIDPAATGSYVPVANRAKLGVLERLLKFEETARGEDTPLGRAIDARLLYGE